MRPGARQGTHEGRRLGLSAGCILPAREKKRAKTARREERTASYRRAPRYRQYKEGESEHGQTPCHPSR